jgi:hypothetical protein
LRIISLNAWGGRLHEALIDYVRQSDADVLCLQEVLRAPDPGSGWPIYRDSGLELPQRANLFAEISAALPGHDGFFCPTSRGTLFDGDAAIVAEFGLATFVRKSHSVIAQAIDFDSATFKILARLGLSDLVTGNGLVDTRTSYYLKQGRFADYMLVTPEVKIAKFEVVATPEVSDHRALLLDIV